MGSLRIWLFVMALPLAGCAGGGADIAGRGVGQDRWWEALPHAEWQAYERVPLDQDWFEAYRISDGVVAIYEPGQYEGVISYLVTGTEKALLFDTGLGIGDMRRAVQQLTDLDVVVLNSHTHYDHIGGNYQFDDIYGTALPYTRRHALGGETSDVAEYIGPGWVAKPLPAGFSPTDYRSRPFAVTRTVADGDSIELGGRRLEVLMTPGHAPDSLCLLDREARILFSGDTFYLGPLYAHIEGSNFDAYAASAERLAALAPAYDSVYMAHDLPVADGGHLVALAQAFRAIRDGVAAEVEETDGNRQYFFDDFSIIVDPADLPAQ